METDDTINVPEELAWSQWTQMLVDFELAAPKMFSHSISIARNFPQEGKFAVRYQAQHSEGRTLSRLIPLPCGKMPLRISHEKVLEWFANYEKGGARGEGSITAIVTLTHSHIASAEARVKDLEW